MTGLERPFTAEFLPGNNGAGKMTKIRPRHFSPQLTAANSFSGFTVLEVLVAASVLSILLFIALPTYSQYVVRGYRVDAINHLLKIAACQEQRRSITGHYDPLACQPVLENRRYRYTVGLADGGGYTLLATQKSPSEDDQCGNLGLDHTGKRTISGPAARLNACWSGR